MKYVGGAAVIKRLIIRVDEEKCDGCGLCIPGCAEGALQIVDGKARIVKESYCDGLGACLGDCPKGALLLEERMAEAFDPEAVEVFLASQQADNTQASGVKDKEVFHEAKQASYQDGCPGLRELSLGEPQKHEEKAPGALGGEATPLVAVPSQLRHWPVQLGLISPSSSHLDGADLLLAADCVPFAMADFHQRLLQGRVVAVSCPKLDDTTPYVHKLASIIRHKHLNSITVARMRVPCCQGLVRMVQLAMGMAGVFALIREIVISPEGVILGETVHEISA